MAPRHREPDEPGDERQRAVAGRRPGPKHEQPGRPRRRPAYKRTPVQVIDRPRSSAPATTSPRVRATPHPGPVAHTPAHPGRGGRTGGGRTAAVVGQAQQYANRAALRAQGGKPSVTGRAVSGAAAGTATGAALGSVVPGVGTAVGAGAGAVVGGAGGALSGAKAKRAYKAAMRVNPGIRRVIVAEFAVCVVIAALSPLTDRNKDEPPTAWMKRMTAVMGVFFLLALLSAGGRGMAKAAAGFGGLVTVVLAVSQRDLFAKIADIFAPAKQKLTPAGPDEDLPPDRERPVGTPQTWAPALPGRRTAANLRAV